MEVFGPADAFFFFLLWAKRKEYHGLSKGPHALEFARKTY